MILVSDLHLDLGSFELGEISQSRNRVIWQPSGESSRVSP